MTETTPPVVGNDAVLERAAAKGARKIVPFLCLMFVIAFLDRTNIGFARNELQADTGLSDAAYAFGAGIFFFGYALCEVPSNMVLYKVGARRWLARIMITWGLVAAAMMFAHTEGIFYLIRFLLGAAEAGFYPGAILYMTFWFPTRMRARMNALFQFGAPLAFVIGGPVSGWLLSVSEGWFWSGSRGWQNMFLIEGLVACLVGVIAWFYLPDGPRDAT
ncbi:MAG: MFS transporter, partial [Propionibacteriaceae bacterium]|nr:MFS transporter [Propionibacteriaceae bacterium]